MRAGSPTIRISTRLVAWPVPPHVPPRTVRQERRGVWAFWEQVSGHRPRS
jgi:hypothetical protein